MGYLSKAAEPVAPCSHSSTGGSKTKQKRSEASLSEHWERDVDSHQPNAEQRRRKLENGRKALLYFHPLLPGPLPGLAAPFPVWEQGPRLRTVHGRPHLPIIRYVHSRLSRASPEGRHKTVCLTQNTGQKSRVPCWEKKQQGRSPPIGAGGTDARGRFPVSRQRPRGKLGEVLQGN